MTDRVEKKLTPWTPAIVEKLVELWDMGLSYNQIAKSFGTGFTRCSVAGKAKRLGLKRARQTSRPTPGIITRFTPVRKERQKVEPTSLDEPDPSLAKTLLSSLSKDCRWPLEHVDGEPMICGAKKLGDGPYCEFHRAKSRQPSQPRRDNEKQLNWRSRI